MEEKRIIVNGRFQHQPVTGVQRYAFELTRQLIDRLEIVAPEKGLRGFRAHWWEQTTLRKHVRHHLLWSPANTGPLGEKNQVLTIHDVSFFDHAESFSRTFATWYQWLVPRLAKKVKHILTVSDFSKKRIVDYCQVAPQKITVIPNGVGCEFHPREPIDIESTRRRLQLPEKYVLCVGSLEPRKNLSRLLTAWNSIATRTPDLYLVLAGGTNHVFRSAGISSPPSRVKLTGHVRDEDLPALYSGAVCFVFPSLYEGFGFPVLEAMACGTPVICSETTSIPEVAGDAALYIQPQDVDSIARSIHSLIEDEKLQSRLRAQGLDQAKKFDWDKTARLTWNVLQRAADKN